MPATRGFSSIRLNRFIERLKLVKLGNVVNEKWKDTAASVIAFPVTVNTFLAQMIVNAGNCRGSSCAYFFCMGSQLAGIDGYLGILHER